MSQKIRFCDHCVYPFDVGVINWGTGKLLQAVRFENRQLCECCADFLASTTLGETAIRAASDMLGYLNKKRVAYAYSGGLDSTCVLYKLIQHCATSGCELAIFTIDNGVKGSIAHKNVRSVLSHLGVKDNHQWIDIRHTMQTHERVLEFAGKGLTSLQVYEYCYLNEILPCGKLCNTVMDGAYRAFLEGEHIPELVTGGDTPKKNSAGEFTIFWTKPSGLSIVRGGYGFNLSKSGNRRMVQELGIPWQDPRCGGYDTDCLMPGVYFGKRVEHVGSVTMHTLATRHQIVLDYLSERVRFGVLDRDTTLADILKLDIASLGCRNELAEIFSAEKD